MGTVNAKKKTNVLRVWTSILFFVHFVCGFAAWMFFLAHAESEFKKMSQKEPSLMTFA